MSTKVTYSDLAKRLRQASTGASDNALTWLLLGGAAWQKASNGILKGTPHTLAQTLAAATSTEHLKAAARAIIDAVNDVQLRKVVAAFAAGLDSLPQEIRFVDIRPILDHIIEECMDSKCDYLLTIADIQAALTQFQRPPDRYHWLPDEIADLLIQLAEIQPEDRVLCLGRLPLKLAVLAASRAMSVSVLQVLDEHLVALVAYLAEVHIAIVPPLDSKARARNNPPSPYDVVLALMPAVAEGRELALPFPSDDKAGKASKDGSFVSSIALAVRRRAVVVAPNTFLGRIKGPDADVKRNLVDRGQVAAVIALPRAVIETTPERQSIIVVSAASQKMHSDTVFMNASGTAYFEPRLRRAGRNKFSQPAEVARMVLTRVESPDVVFAPRAQIERHEYNLLAPPYVRNGDFLRSNVKDGCQEITELKDVVELIPARLVPPPTARARFRYFEVMPSSLPSFGYLHSLTGSTDGQFGDPQALEDGVLVRNDLLLVIRGSVGKVGIVNPPDGAIWVSSQAFLILRVRQSILLDPRVLYMYLCSAPVQSWLNEQTTGRTIGFLSRATLARLPVPVPTPDLAAKMIAGFDACEERRRQIEERESEIREVGQRDWFGAMQSIADRGG